MKLSMSRKLKQCVVYIFTFFFASFQTKTLLLGLLCTRHTTRLGFKSHMIPKKVLYDPHYIAKVSFQWQTICC